MAADYHAGAYEIREVESDEADAEQCAEDDARIGLVRG
jgi:hypothetical protein